MSIWKIIKRELRQIFLLDPRRIIFIFMAGIIYLFLFGGLYMPQAVKHIPIVICDEEQSAFSRSLTQRFEDAEEFQVVDYIPERGEAEKMLRSKEAYAVLEIPQDFSMQIKTGHPERALVLINGSNILITTTTMLAGENILNEFSDETAVKRIAAATGENQDYAMHQVAPISFEWRVLNNPVRGYFPFFVIGLSLTAFQAGMFLEMGASIHTELRNLSELSRISVRRLLAVKFLIHWLFSFAAFGLILLALVTWGQVDNRASLWQLLLLNGCFSFAVLSLGITVAPLFHSEFDFIRTAVFYAVPSFILSGYTWPREAMTGIAVFLSDLFPLTWMANAVRSMLLSGTSWNLWENLVILLVMGIIPLCFLPAAFRRGVRRASAVHENMSE
jgi:ABC-2 type transport system permease protein